MTHRTTDQGLRFIVCREAVVLQAYLDDTKGGDHYSIGPGSQMFHRLGEASRPVAKGDRCTIEEALYMARINCDERDRTLNNWLTTQIDPNQFDGVGSLFYQRGSKAAQAVIAWYNQHEPMWAAEEYIKWASGQDGKKTRGHMHRRIEEMAVAALGYYGDLTHFLLFDTDQPRGKTGTLTPFP